MGNIAPPIREKCKPSRIRDCTAIALLSQWCRFVRWFGDEKHYAYLEKLDLRSYRHHTEIDFSRPGKQPGNYFTCNGLLLEECPTSFDSLSGRKIVARGKAALVPLLNK